MASNFPSHRHVLGDYYSSSKQRSKPLEAMVESQDDILQPVSISFAKVDDLQQGKTWEPSHFRWKCHRNPQSIFRKEVEEEGDEFPSVQPKLASSSRNSGVLSLEPQLQLR